VVRVLAAAEETFGSQDKASRWLRRPTKVLEGEAPLEMLDTTEGAREVEDRPWPRRVTTVWRICRRPFADLSGDGARLYGGRWNTPGRPLIYAAETAALTVLEVRVHLDLDWDMLPDDYVLVAIDTAAIVAETINEPPDDPRAIGDAWM
jgi:RES domain-containing protein